MIVLKEMSQTPGLSLDSIKLGQVGILFLAFMNSFVSLRVPQ
jgi:hypothetical protein